MIDLHTHILPGIDDGVKTDDEALAFARMAHDDGIRTIVATPHCKEGFYFNRRDDVVSGVERLRPLLAGAGIDVELLPGAEVHICPDLVARIADGRAPTLAMNGKTLLLELSLSQYPVNLEQLVFELKLAGVIVLFAHPERIRFFLDDVRRYEEVVRLGAFGQLTSGSLTGRFGENVRKFSHRLLRKGLVHVLASDAHNTRGRSPHMAEAVEVAAGVVGAEFARAMVESAPRALLDGREPDMPPLVTDGGRRRGLIGRWFGRGGN